MSVNTGQWLRAWILEARQVLPFPSCVTLGKLLNFF